MKWRFVWPIRIELKHITKIIKDHSNGKSVVNYDRGRSYDNKYNVFIDVIIKLLVPASSKRIKYIYNIDKLRIEYAKVLEIKDMNDKKYKKGKSYTELFW